MKRDYLPKIRERAYWQKEETFASKLNGVPET